MALNIVCVNKVSGNHDNPYLAITHLTWRNDQSGQSGTSTREEMYEFIESGGEAYVEDNSGDKAYLVCETRNGTRYVKTHPDNKTSNNLLRLPQC